MTKKEDYSADEWELLLEVPALVGLAVMVAGKSGLGSVRESMAIASGLLNPPDALSANELVQALYKARVQDGARSRVETLASPLRGKSAEQLQQAAVERCRDVADLLTRSSDPTEAAGYRQWTLHIASQVAQAAKEGGFLGMGGQRVSPVEEQAIAAISAALEGISNGS